MLWGFYRTNGEVLRDIERRMKAMFEVLNEKVTKITDAAEAIKAELRGVRTKLSEIIAGGGLSEEAKARLVALESALDTEANEMTEAILEGTPAAPPA